MGRIAGHVLEKQAKAQKIADSTEHCITGKAPVRQAAKMLIVGLGENEPGEGTPPLLMGVYLSAKSEHFTPHAMASKLLSQVEPDRAENALKEEPCKLCLSNHSIETCTEPLIYLPCTCS